MQLYKISPTYDLTLGVDFCENNLIVIACRSLIGACDFYIHNLGTYDIKHIEFQSSPTYNTNFSFIGGIVIGNYYYARFQEYRYVRIDIYNPDPEYWINIDGMSALDYKTTYTSSDNHKKK